MPDEHPEFDNQGPLEIVPDFLYEDRHEYVERRAYELWEKRGRPFGSPDVDWLAAEQTFYSALLVAGMIAPPRIGQGNARQQIYHR